MTPKKRKVPDSPRCYSRIGIRKEFKKIREKMD
jgi:hypothetical protein